MFALNQVLLPLVLVSTIVFGLPLIENNIFGSHGVDMPNMAIRFPIKSENDRIYGGEEAAIGQFPYQISLQVRPSEDNYVHFCGGAIISSRYILTAAHCFIANFPDLRDYRVVVGAHDAHDGNDGKAHGIGRFIFHQDYTNNITEINGTIINDIALIETDSPIQFNNLVAPIALHPKFFENGTRAVASGWGQTDDFITTLKFLHLNTLTNSDCRARIATIADNQTAVVHDFSTLCAFSGQHGHGLCSGDSGGPLVIDNQLIGIASWAVPCAVGMPDGFTRISSHIDWVKHNMRLL